MRTAHWKISVRWLKKAVVVFTLVLFTSLLVKTKWTVIPLLRSNFLIQHRTAFGHNKNGANFYGILGGDDLDIVLTPEHKLQLHLLDEQYNQKIRSLKIQIQTLKEELAAVGEYQKQSEVETENVVEQNSPRLIYLDRPKNEFEVIPFEWFNGTHVLHPSSSKSDPEIVSGSLQKEMFSVSKGSLGTANDVGDGHPAHFMGTLYREVASVGSFYEVLWRSSASVNQNITRSTIIRPYGLIQLLNIQQNIQKQDPLINIIVHIEECCDQFELFFDFLCQRIPKQMNTHLTITCPDYRIREEIMSTINTTGKHNKCSVPSYSLLCSDEIHSEKEGYNKAAQLWNSDEDIILLFLESDIVFSSETLIHCRTSVSKHQSVYFPVVFSLFNPSFAFKKAYKNTISLEKVMKIAESKGSWNKVYHSVSCQHLSDFLSVAQTASVPQTTSTSYQDLLYNSFVQSNVMIVRAPDPSLFRLWTQTVCEDHLSNNDFLKCLQLRAQREGPQTELGIAILSEGIK